MAKLTVANYVQERGSRCPNCLSHNVHGCDVDMDDGRVFQNCLCYECKAEWTDVYSLTSYSELTVPTEVL